MVLEENLLGVSVRKAGFVRLCAAGLLEAEGTTSDTTRKAHTWQFNKDFVVVSEFKVARSGCTAFGVGICVI